jgi:hypothetical protein
MGDTAEFYRSYLLRVWRAGSADAPIWRLLIEDVQTHERHGFSTPEQLVAFLQSRFGGTPARSPTAADDPADPASP